MVRNALPTYRGLLAAIAVTSGCSDGCRGATNSAPGSTGPYASASARLISAASTLQPTHPPQPDAAPTSVASSSPPAGPCAAIDAHNDARRKTAARAVAEAKRSGLIHDSWDLPSLPPLPCVVTPGGAWALKAGEVQHSGVTESHLELVHVGANGHEVTAAYELFRDAGGLVFRCCSPTSEVKEFAVFDLDGVGEPEVTFVTAAEGAEGNQFEHRHALRFEGDRIVPHTLPRGGRPSDVDRDGIVDLVIEHDEQIKISCLGAGAFTYISGPDFLAHGLGKGRYSRSDAVAQAYAHKQCPGRPQNIGVSANGRPGIIDEHATAKNAMCARAYGVELSALVAELEKVCKEPAPRDDCLDADKPRPGECFGRAILLEWLSRLEVVFPAHDAGAQ